MKIERFEDIRGWQLGRELTNQVYEITKTGPFSKDYELKSQIRSAAGSIMHNIAEGFDGGSNPEFIKFLRYSQRSCSEVQSELYVALDQSYLDQACFDQLYAMAKLAHSTIGGLIFYLLKNGAAHRSS